MSKLSIVVKAQAADITFEDGTTLDFPADWIVDVQITARPPTPVVESISDRNARQRDLLLGDTL